MDRRFLIACTSIILPALGGRLFNLSSMQTCPYQLLILTADWETQIALLCSWDHTRFAAFLGLDGRWVYYRISFYHPNTLM